VDEHSRLNKILLKIIRPGMRIKILNGDGTTHKEYLKVAREEQFMRMFLVLESPLGKEIKVHKSRLVDLDPNALADPHVDLQSLDEDQKGFLVQHFLRGG
jgi:hypothetical protein